MNPVQYVGLDIIEVCRIEEAVSRWGDRFLQRVYTEKELGYCRGRSRSLAARFAAKEAVAKALGTGIGRIAFKDIEIVSGPRKQPHVVLRGRALSRSRRLGLTNLAISLSHCRDYAAASFVGGCS
ncbi:MAG: holo-ACP synthase [Dehalococcoidia bacterium]|nr:holo-ACP synthase [Dehalococcoidia bacterium]